MIDEMTPEEREKVWESMDPQSRVDLGRRWDEEMKHLTEMDGVMRKLVWRGKILDYFITSVDWSDDLNLPEDHPYHEEKGDFTAFVEHPHRTLGGGDVNEKYLVFAYIMGRMPEDGCPLPNDPVSVQIQKHLDEKFAELDEGEVE